MTATLSQTATAVNWTGEAGDNDFNNPENWVDDELPNLNEVGVFSNGGVVQSAPVLLTDGITVAGVTSKQAATLTLDTNGNTLILDTATGNDFRAVGGGDLNLSGDFGITADGSDGIDVNLNVRSQSGSVNFSNAMIDGAGVSGSLINFGDGVSGLADSQIENFDIVRILTGGTLSVTGDSSITGRLRMVGGTIAISAGDTLSVTGLTNANACGTWAFDLNNIATSSDALISTSVLNLNDIDLDLFNVNSSTNFSSPVILATYTTLSGNGTFDTVDGLGPNQTIDYNFDLGNGQFAVAIVPEPSNVLPALLGFLPLLFLRKRLTRMS